MPGAHGFGKLSLKARSVEPGTVFPGRFPQQPSAPLLAPGTPVPDREDLRNPDPSLSHPSVNVEVTAEGRANKRAPSLGAWVCFSPQKSNPASHGAVETAFHCPSF